MNMKEINKCPVCGKENVFEFDICPVCGWENDPNQVAHPDDLRGANQMTLNEAKEAYKKGLEIK